MRPYVFKLVSRVAPQLIVLSLFFAANAYGQKMFSKEAASKGGDIPVHVNAERMDVDHVANLIRFSGRVVTTRGSMVIRSDELEVFNSESGEGTDKIKKIVARGNVEFEHETKKATGDEATYLAHDRTVVLQGRARAWDGDNEVTGHRMRFYLDEDKSVVESGGDQRVKVILKSKDGQNGGGFRIEESKAKGSKGEESPVHITADRMEADHQQKIVYFEGNVKTKRADFTMDSDDLEVFDSGQEPRQISKIVARGNVRIDQGGKIATGDRAVYFEGERKFLLTGHAKAWENMNVVAGSRMEIYLDQDKSVVLGDGKEQVEVTIFPGEKTTSKQPLPIPALAEDGALETAPK